MRTSLTSILAIVLLAACALTLAPQPAMADTATVTVTAAGAATYSAAIPASGWLDRIELVKSSDNDVVDVVVATYSGTTALTTFASISAMATSSDTAVIVPRKVATTSAGVAMTAVTSADTRTTTNNVCTTILAVPYERYMIGGNVKLKVGASAGTNATVTATIYYEPTKR